MTDVLPLVAPTQRPKANQLCVKLGGAKSDFSNRTFSDIFGLGMRATKACSAYSIFKERLSRQVKNDSYIYRARCAVRTRGAQRARAIASDR